MCLSTSGLEREFLIVDLFNYIVYYGSEVAKEMICAGTAGHVYNTKGDWPSG